jgi:hypothetical protein
MLTRGVLNVVSSTTIALGLGSTSGGTIIAGALGEPIVRSTRAAIARGVEALNRGGSSMWKGWETWKEC